MPSYRNCFLAFIPCFLAAMGIYLGLEALGADEQTSITIEVVWILVTVWICLSVDERAERK
jgi:hypothetical protein